MLGGIRSERHAAAALVGERDRVAQFAVRFLAQKCFRGPDCSSGGAHAGEKVSLVPAYRVSALFPDVHDTRISPRWRAYQGEEVSAANSRVYFERGEPLAGDAWVAADEDGLTVRDDFPALVDVRGDHAEWRSQWMRRGVPPHVLQDMGTDRRRGWCYMEHVRSILCFRVPMPGWSFTVAIDSVHREAFEPECLNMVESAPDLVVLTQFLARQMVPAPQVTRT